MGNCAPRPATGVATATRGKKAQGVGATATATATASAAATVPPPLFDSVGLTPSYADRQGRAVRFAEIPEMEPGRGPEDSEEDDLRTPKAERSPMGSVQQLLCVDGIWNALVCNLIEPSGPLGTASSQDLKQQQQQQQQKKGPKRRVLDNYFVEPGQQGAAVSGGSIKLPGNNGLASTPYVTSTGPIRGKGPSATPKPKPLDPQMRQWHKQLSNRNLLGKEADKK